MIKVKRRVAQYLVVTIVTLLLYLLFRNVKWNGFLAIHTLLETIGAIIALIVGIMAIIRHYSRKNFMLLIIGAGFIAVSLLDGYHTIVTILFMHNELIHGVENIVSSSWSSSRMLLALITAGSYLTMLYDRRELKGTLKEWYIYLIVTLSAGLLPFGLTTFPYGPLTIFNLYIHYPFELISALIFLPPLIFYLRSGVWMREDFNHWLVVFLLISVAIQLIVALIPAQSSDTLLAMAHLLKIISYTALLSGLFIKMYRDFKKVNEMIDLGRETEWALRDSQTKLNRSVKELKVLLSSIPARVYSKTSDLTFTTCNDAFAIYHSITIEDVVGKSDYDLFSYEQAKQYRERDRECLRRGIPEYGIEQVESLDSDEPRWELNTRVPYRDEKGKVAGLVVTSLDITTQKETEQALKVAIKEAGEARRAAEDANRAKSEFLANMSHEIRTPMNGVIGTVDLALMSSPEGQHKEFLEQIKTSAESLLDIINDILDFSKIEAGKLDLEAIPFSLREIVESSVQVIAMKARRKGLEVLSYLTPVADRTFIGDPVRLRQVILNLLSNAVKFTEEGHIYLVAKVKELKGDEVKVSISVLDTGVGIDSDKKQRLFKAFSQADSSTTRKYGGTGLGLVISAQLVEMMKGNIGFVSTRGKGTLFSFKVWLGKGKKRDSKGERVFTTGKAPRVVVCTKGTLLMKLLNDSLGRWGIETRQVDDVEQLGGKVEDMADLLIFDEVVGNIKLPVEIPHLLLTSNCDCVEDGINCLLKPFSESKLKRALISLFETKKLTMEREELMKNEGVEMIEEREYPEGTTILLVEDNEINRKIALKMLTNRGLTVVTAVNGSEAIQAFKETIVHLVIMDIQMPVMDGFEATCQLKLIMEERGSRVPIIALTAYAMKGDKDKILRAGMDDYLTKPLTAKALYEVIDKHLFSTESNELQGKEQPAETDYNLQVLVDALGGDREFAVMLLHDFDKIYRESLDKIDTAIAEGDRENLRVLAHTMKGQILNLHLLSASPVMKRLDESSINAPKEQLKALSREVRIETEKVMDFIRANIF